jgi:hypothetical protein
VPTVFAHQGVTTKIIITPTDLIKQVQTLGKKHQHVVKRLLVNIAKIGQQAYRVGVTTNAFNLKPLAESTLRSRIRGKLAGTGGPAKPRSRGGIPLRYSGQTVRAYRIRRQSSFHIVLGFTPGETIRYSPGASVKDIAENVHETGKSLRVRYTARMLAYMHILFRKTGQRGARAGEESAGRGKRPRRVGVSVNRRIPARRALKHVALAIQKRMPTELRNARKELRDQTTIRFR